MTCVCREYESKIKNGTAAMTTAKNEVFMGYNMKNCYLVGDEPLVGE